MTFINALLEIPLLLVLMFPLHFTPEVRSVPSTEKGCNSSASFSHLLQ